MTRDFMYFSSTRTLIGLRRICGGGHHVTERLVGLLRQERCRQCAGMRHVRLRPGGDAQLRLAALPLALAPRLRCLRDAGDRATARDGKATADASKLWLGTRSPL